MRFGYCGPVMGFIIPHLEFNLSTSMRLSWVESSYSWIFFVPMVVFGFDVVQILVSFLAVLIYQTWIHTERIGTLGWLDKVFNTPSIHRVHHGTNAKYIDKNYGGFLILWDRLFGTYQAEEETVIYGVLDPVNSINPVKINFIEYFKIAVDAARSRSLSDAFRYIFGRPGWTAKTKKKPS